MRELEIAALMCSKICHDLISPVGAMANGLEVLADDDSAEMRDHAMALLEQSARTASAKLQFARLAFGAAGSAGETIDLAYAEQVVRGLFDGGRITVDWQAADGPFPKNTVRLMLNMIMLAAEALPRGGVITLKGQASGDDRITVIASGERAVLPDSARFLSGDVPGDIAGLDAREIQPYVTGLLAGTLHVALSARADEDTVVFEAVLPRDLMVA